LPAKTFFGTVYLLNFFLFDLFYKNPGVNYYWRVKEPFMKKTHIIVKAKDLEKFLTQLDSSPQDQKEWEKLRDKFDLKVLDLSEENLRDLFAKLHVLPDDELQEALKSCPEIRELWYDHFARWAFGGEPDPF
jgi:phytoene dehydrogenase-like protein